MRTGRRLRGFDAIVVVHVIPAVVPAHLALLRAAGAGRRGSGGPGPRTVVIAHNVLPHEPHLGDRELMRSFLERVDAVLVHSAAQARLAHDLGAPRVSVPTCRRTCPAEPPPTARPTTARRGCSRSGSSASTRASTCCCGPSRRCPGSP